MKFSAKGEYGVRAVLDIALNQESGPVQVKEIAKRQSIPERFLEQVMSSLKKAGLVEAFRGAQGGYLLAKNASEISLADVVQSLEGPLTLMECVSEESPQRCDQISLCVIRDVWIGVQSTIVEALASITIEEMCKKQREKENRVGYMYQI
ncbi:MAG: RrF2 family transcriptional regulator [Terriglobia bacterium]